MWALGSKLEWRLMLISVALLSEMWLTTLSSVEYYWWWWNWEPVSDGGGHLALVLMLTLLHGRLRLPKCKTGFYFGFWVRQKKSDTVDRKYWKKSDNALMFLKMHCASSDATFYPGMHGLTQDEVSSRHTCASEDDCSITRSKDAGHHLKKVKMIKSSWRTQS